MASFRSAVGTHAAATSEITADLPAGIVAGDLLVMYVAKTQTDRPVAPDGWFDLGFYDHGIGSRRVSMGCWTIATAALVAAGTVDVVCTTSTNDATMRANVLAFDISDWDGLRWNMSDFTHATGGTTLAGTSLTTIFANGISIVFHAVGVTSRTDVGTTTEGGVASDHWPTETFSPRVWYNVAETGELAEIATIGNAGTINATQTGFACFGPSPDATTVDPCPDFDGVRVGF